METIFKLGLSAEKLMRIMVLCVCMLFGYYVQVTYQASKCIDLNYNNINYLFCYSSKSRSIAQQECKNNSMELAVIRTELEFQYWRNYFRRNHSSNEMWLAARYSKEQQAFLWDTGGYVPVTFFGANLLNMNDIANGTCLRIYTDQWLKPLGCSENRGSLCQGKEMTTTIDSTTSVITFTDTAISTPSMLTKTAEVSMSVTNAGTNEKKVTEADTTGYIASRLTAITGTLNLATTQEKYQSATGDRMCLCSCLRVAKYPNDTTSMMHVLDNITRELSINQSTLSAFIRKKTSIMDNRPLARGIGYSGVIIMICISLIIVLMDLTNFINCLSGSYGGRKINLDVRELYTQLDQTSSVTTIEDNHTGYERL